MSATLPTREILASETRAQANATPATPAAVNPAYERAVRLVAQIFRVPFALVVEASEGLPTIRASHGPDAGQLAREPVFAAGTLLVPVALAIADAARDDRLRTSPVVTGPPGVRFYAGVPLTNARGHRLGTLAIADTRPRHFTAEETALLAALASGAVEQTETRQTMERIAGELEERKCADRTVRARRDELEVRVHERTEALAEAEARYQSIFEHAAEGIYQMEPGGRFLSVNPAFAQLFGHPSPERLMAAVADPAQLYVRPAERAEIEGRLLREGKVQNREVEAYRADGSRMWLSENAHVVRDSRGRVVRFEGTVDDITARRAAEEALQRAHEELEDRVRERTMELALLNGDPLAQIAERQHAEEAAHRSESKFRTLLENAQDLISIFTPEGVLLYASPSLQHILGYRPEELIGVNLFDGYLHPDDYADTLGRLTRPRQEDGSYLRSEVRMRHRDGIWRTLESISSPLPPEFPVVGVVVNSRDITERRRNEREAEARARQQAAVAELGRHALRGVDLPALFERTAELVARTLGVDRCGIGEFLPGGDRMSLRAGHGFPSGEVGNTVFGNWHDQAADAERPLVVADLRTVLNYSGLPTAANPAISAASAVIHDGEQRYGTVAALSTIPRTFTPEEQVFLQTVADLLSTVVESRRHQAALQEVETRYQRNAANTPGMVYQAIRHTDGSATVPFVSEGCRQIYGLEPAQIRAEPNLLDDPIHPEDRPRVLAALAASSAALTPLQWEGRILQADGGVRWVAVRSRPERLPNGDIYRDGVVVDVTELKHAQEAMRAAKEEAERANCTKSEFLSRMSHELRTPLNAILGFGQLLQLEPLAPMQATSVDQILAGGRHLLDLVNEILDIARIEAGDSELHLESFDLNESAAGTLRFVGPLAAQYKVRLVHRDPTAAGFMVLADRRRLNQVLLNLLSNAIKYNREGGSVRVGCRWRPDGQLRLTVTDTGPGLTPAETGQLFTPFQRLKAPERGITGTGIGLTITKALVEAMHGTVGARSRPGWGSRFHVDLPAVPPSAPRLVSREAGQAGGVSDPLAASAARIKTVLHIDDQPANVALVERVLGHRADLRLLAATNGRDGFACARAERPDLILLDLHLPDINGDEVLRQLRAEPPTHGIPVLMLSADATPRQMARLRGLGVRDYLTKPFQIAALIRAVDEALHAAG